MTIVLRECRPEDTEVLASVLAPAFEEWVSVMAGDMDRAMRVIPGIIDSMAGDSLLALEGGRPVGGILVTYDEPHFLGANALGILRALGPLRAIRAYRLARDYLRSAPSRPAGEAWVEAVGVLASHRRKGIGRMLMERVASEARDAGLVSVGLGVRSDSAAVEFYRELGFVEVSRYSNRLGEWSYLRLRLDAGPS
ncbi:MAG: GNAT family N-acetyltransferase [Thermoplasmata archaeon]|nr:GNAT family N-acetyltransferase [Thermoplasmata archaeon]